MLRELNEIELDAVSGGLTERNQYIIPTLWEYKGTSEFYTIDWKKIWNDIAPILDGSIIIVFAPGKSNISTADGTYWRVGGEKGYYYEYNERGSTGVYTPGTPEKHDYVSQNATLTGKIGVEIKGNGAYVEGTYEPNGKRYWNSVPVNEQ